LHTEIKKDSKIHNSETIGPRAFWLAPTRSELSKLFFYVGFVRGIVRPRDIPDFLKWLKRKLENRISSPCIKKSKQFRFFSQQIDIYLYQLHFADKGWFKEYANCFSLEKDLIPRTNMLSLQTDLIATI